MKMTKSHGWRWPKFFTLRNFIFWFWPKFTTPTNIQFQFQFQTVVMVWSNSFGHLHSVKWITLNKRSQHQLIKMIRRSTAWVVATNYKQYVWVCLFSWWNLRPPHLLYSLGKTIKALTCFCLNKTHLTNLQRDPIYK